MSTCVIATTDSKDRGMVDTGGNPMMADTHKIGDAAKKVVDLLDKMASADR
jgi:hypothetical protein